MPSFVAPSSHARGIALAVSCAATAAILGGASIGNAIANAPSGGSAHVRWCYDHYRSYRASDNTYQPYHGPRRQCNSPYG